jgi:hypothetical protein
MDLANGTAADCEVRAVSAAGESSWVAATGTPAGAPLAPLGVAAEGADAGARLTVEAGPDGGSAITGYTFECAPAGDSPGWTRVAAAAAGTTDAAYAVTGLANGTHYTCRAYAANSLGTSPVSGPSNDFLACNGLVACNWWIPWLVWLLLALVLVAILFWLADTWMNRKKRYISAQVDSYPALELGIGPVVGVMFERDRRRRIVGLLATTFEPDIDIRYNGGSSFTVTGGGEPAPFASGVPGSITDRTGEAHQLILRAARRPQSDGAIYDEAGA